MCAEAKNWAKRERERLMTILGGKCVFCGETSNLTFDCIKPQGGAHHKGSTDQRMCFYRKMFFAGNLQILCHSCNSKKAAHEQPVYLPPQFPF